MYFPQLDAFRFLLFVFILVSHSYVDPEVVYDHPWITAFYRTGWIGVQGFFVLSGFIITHILLREYNEQQTLSFKHFYLRRALKIIPPFYLSTIIILALSHIPLLSESEVWNHLPANKEHLSQAISELHYFLLFIGNIPLALGQIEYTTPAILISWTLAIEEQFYLIQPLLLAWGLSQKNSINTLRIILWSTIATSLLIRLTTALLFEESFYRNFNNTFTLCQFDSIAFGCIIAIESSSKDSWLNKLGSILNQKSTLTLSVIILSFFLIISMMINTSTPLTYTVGFTAINVFFALVIFTLIDRPDISRNKSFLSRLGRNGYCLYLSHHIALIISYEILIPGLADNISASYLYWSRIILALILSVIFAKALYLLSELPFERLRKNLRPPK